MSRKRRARADRAPLVPLKGAGRSPSTVQRGDWQTRSFDWLFGPQPVERLVLIRIVVSLTVLGFISSRVVHADEWLSPRGFHVPDLGGDDWRQPLYLPPIPPWAAWVVAGGTVLAGVCLAVGFVTRPASALFAALVGYLVLADRLEAFTVTKLAPVLSLALAASPCGSRFSIDAWRRARRSGGVPPDSVPGGTVRFLQIFLVIMYSGAGVAKVRGDWLSADVLWSHLHDNYQTTFSWHVMNALPAGSWKALQYLTLTFELGAPLWFALPWTRIPALLVGLGMHVMIGLMFGPVVWFALLMGGLLIACYAPGGLLRRAFRRPTVVAS